MSRCPSPQPLLNLDTQHHRSRSRRRRLRNRQSLHLLANRKRDNKMQSQSSTSSSTATTSTVNASRGQSRQMTSTPVNQPRGDFTGLNGLIRAALVEDSAIAVAAAAAAAASSPQFQLPASMGPSQMHPPPPPAAISQPPAAHHHPYHHPHPFQAVPASAISVSTSSTASAWPDYLPLGRGIGYMHNHTNPEVNHHHHHHHQQQQQPQRAHSSNQTRIPTPCNRSQLSLYRVLEHANLLEYFETFIALGGDDVQQLVEADEDEFLEIMSLVGMTQKPLHVRRLQKTLLKWRQDRRFFQLNGPLSSRYAHYKLYNSPAKYILPFSQVVSEPELDSGQDSSMDQSQSSANHRQYLAPREVIKGAPKRPRLMDNLIRSGSAPNNYDAALPVATTTDTEADESEVEVEDVACRKN